MLSVLRVGGKLERLVTSHPTYLCLGMQLKRYWQLVLILLKRKLNVEIVLAVLVLRWRLGGI